MTRALNLVAVLLSLAQAATLAAGEPGEIPPLTAPQRTQIAELAKQTQEEGARLKAQLEERQRKLAAIYAAYKLDGDSATQLETEILDLQRQMLVNYRRMQVELRKVVSEERFAILRQRLDHFLQSPRTEPRASPYDATGSGARPVGVDRAAGTPEAVRQDRPVEKVFSGPQVGEKLPPLPVRGVFDAEAGQEFDFVRLAGGKPIVLVFVHEANRPSIAMTRALTSYTVQRAKDELVTGVVWLDDDVTAAENSLKRMRHALTPGAPTGISTAGKEGPGSYGLNRNVTLTILVGNQGRVTANFALVQPSLQADLPRVFDEIVRMAGGKAPTLAEVIGGREMQREPAATEPDPRMRELIGPVIRLNATVEAVDKAAEAVEAYVADNVAARKEVGRIASTIVGSGKLSDYGTPRAREHLRKWAEKYGDTRTRPAEKQEPSAAAKAPPETPR